MMTSRPTETPSNHFSYSFNVSGFQSVLFIRATIQVLIHSFIG